MIKNYYKSGLKTLIRNKSFSILNILGLSVGLTVGILIFLWVVDEMSFDNFHQNHKHIYRLVHESFSMGESNHFTSCPPTLGPLMKDRYPEIEKLARFRSFGTEKVVFKDKAFMERYFYYADKEILEIFSFDFVYGNVSNALDDPYGIIISLSSARKFFGDKNPMGKTIIVDDQDTYKIAGVFNDFPKNSNVKFDFIVPFNFLKEIGFDAESWQSFSWQTFLLLDKSTDIELFGNKIKGVINEFVDDEKYVLKLQGLDDIHLYNIDGSAGRIKYVRIFIIIGIVIIFLACINFMNLSIVRSIKRSREIGVRKAIGAMKYQLIVSFLSETSIMVFIALIISMSLVELLRSFFNEITGKSISLAYLNIEFVFALILIAIVTVLLSGLYPALMMSSFNPISALKGTKNARGTKGRIRKILVVIQFIITIILISGSITVYRQLKYMNEHDLGVASKNIIYVNIDDRLNAQFEAFRGELLSNPNIEGVTKTFQMPSYNKLSSNIYWDGQEEGYNLLVNISIADHDYIKTFGLEIIEGKNFLKGSSSDSLNTIVNEEAIKQMKLENPVGKSITLWGEGKIIAVVKDYHFMPLTEKIQPLALKIRDGLYRLAVIRVNMDELKKTLKFIEEKYADYTASYPFDYHFMDEDFDRIYSFETRLSKILKYFTALAISIAILGLYGLSAFIAEQTTKEVGIRKTLGASIQNLLFSFVIGFCKWVLLAAIIAIPLSWYIMQNWLLNFAYRIHLSLDIFIFSGLIAIFIAAVTVSIQAYHSAIKNPLDALKHE